jgi:hypothetical protein
MLNKPFHHEFNDLYKENVEDFIKIYNPKKIKIESEYLQFRESEHEYISLE